MPFHHVLLALESEPTKLRCVLTDLTEEDLKAKFLRPYRKGQNIFCGNEVIPASQIRKLHIVRTAHENEVERSALQERSFNEIQEFNRQSDSIVSINPGRGYDPEDILEVGEDVTATFVSGSLGYAVVPTPVVEFLNNQWVVTIGVNQRRKLSTSQRPNVSTFLVC